MVIKCRFDLSHMAKILKNRTDQFLSDKLLAVDSLKQRESVFSAQGAEIRFQLRNS